MSKTKTCECGVEIVSRINFGFLDTLDKHKETEKHALLLELKNNDPESHSLALNKKTEQVKCDCGAKVCRWTLNRHKLTPSHMKKFCQAC